MTRFRKKEGRELADEVAEAGGEFVGVSGKGYLQFRGPLGVATVASDVSGPRAHDQARAALRKHAGIIIPRRGGGSGRKAG